MSHQQTHKKLVLKPEPATEVSTESKQEAENNILIDTLTEKLPVEVTKRVLEVAQFALSKIIIPALDIVVPDSPERAAKKLVRKIQRAK